MPAAQAKGSPTLVVVILLAVIAIAAGLFVKSLLSKRQPADHVYWLCEQCDIESLDLPQQTPRQCPECGGEAYSLTKYVCEQHKEVFRVYLTKPEPESFAKSQAKLKEYSERPEEGSLPPRAVYTRLYKLSGSDEWTAEFPTGICCPRGSCDKASLKYYRPR